MIILSFLVLYNNAKEWHKFGNVERKHIESVINRASARSFTNTARLICSDIHIFYLYVNSVY